MAKRNRKISFSRSDPSLLQSRCASSSVPLRPPKNYLYAINISQKYAAVSALLATRQKNWTKKWKKSLEVQNISEFNELIAIYVIQCSQAVSAKFSQFYFYLSLHHVNHHLPRNIWSFQFHRSRHKTLNNLLAFKVPVNRTIQRARFGGTTFESLAPIWTTKLTINKRSTLMNALIQIA